MALKKKILNSGKKNVSPKKPKSPIFGKKTSKKMVLVSPKKRVYLDYASASPLSKEVLVGLKKWMSGRFGNPSAVHEEGLFVKNILENSRAEIAKTLQVQKDEIIFTSGSTESNNLAIFGLQKNYKNLNEVITFSTEHPAILSPLKKLEEECFSVLILDVSEDGVPSVDELKKKLSEKTLLVSLSAVNSEFGAIAPIRDISRALVSFKKSLGRGENEAPFLHVDCSQAVKVLSIRPHDLGADMMTVEGGKIGGLPGAGLLFVKRGIKISPIIFGGGQEGGVRAGTPPVMLIESLKTSILCAVRDREKFIKHTTKLRDAFLKTVLNGIKGASLNGDPSKCSPHIVNICIPNVSSEFAVQRLNVRGISLSSASACKSVSGNGRSEVIYAIEGNKDCAESSIRVSFGQETTLSEVISAGKTITKLFQK